MTRRTVIHSGKLVLPDRIEEQGYVIFEGEKIIELGKGKAETKSDDRLVDAKGMYISPGFVDIHIHGGGGYDFMDGTVEAFVGVAEAHAKHGTTSLTPTTMTSTDEELFTSLEAYEKAIPENTKGARFLGLHLEGPYFVYNRRGAQDAEYLKKPVPEHYNAVLNKSKNIVRWSIAPELKGALELAKLLSQKGIVAAVAHTDATADEVIAGHKHGFSLMTHFYNAMIGIHNKDNLKTAGTIEAGYLLENMRVELIADAIHVPIHLLEYAYKFKGSDRMCLITDAMRGATMPNGTYKLGSNKLGKSVIVKNGIARMADGGALGGSIATTNLLVQIMTKKVGVSLQEAVKMASLTPARFIGRGDETGSLEKGKYADIILFDKNIDVYHTIVAGRDVYIR